ncbi:DMT family transporter [Eleftheria terrae]|uniref:DMT family transporter n=1 Tax=Eleftheria terrae TaxID=1597781 RepID=UPI00263AF138|nr:DMT family transporter [Eleftheria terrae]WKB53257.1 DMT family transporter [Eleftheria terrae]
MNPPSARAEGVIYGLLSALIWGAFPVVTRLGVARTALDGFDVTALRFGVSGLVLLPYLMRAGRGGVSWSALALMVVGIGAPYMLVVALGLARAPVEHFAVITPGSMILFSVLLSARVLHTRLGGRALGGVALILLGVLLIGLQGLRGAGSGSIGVHAAFLLGGLMWAVYTVTSKACGVQPFHATALVSVASMVLYLPPYLLLRGPALLQAPLHDVLVQGVYQGVLVSIVALFFYSQAVYHLGPARGALFAALVPGMATMLAAFLLGEWPAPFAVLGLAVVTGGMLLSLLDGRSPPAAAPGRS